MSGELPCSLPTFPFCVVHDAPFTASCSTDLISYPASFGASLAEHCCSVCVCVRRCPLAHVHAPLSRPPHHVRHWVRDMMDKGRGGQCTAVELIKLVSSDSARGGAQAVSPPLPHPSSGDAQHVGDIAHGRPEKYGWGPISCVNRRPPTPILSAFTPARGRKHRCVCAPVMAAYARGGASLCVRG